MTQGLNTVMASVTDTSYWIRPYDNENYHQFEVEWDVSSAALGSGQELRILNHSAISVYPNPVNDHLYVKILDALPGDAVIELYDSKGRLMQTHKGNFSGTQRLDLSGFETGIYMVKISQDGKYLSFRKIIKL